jgi:hypothetical protein
VSSDAGRKAIDSFLQWAREAIERDPSHWVDVEKALAETTMPPELRRVVEAELKRLASQHGRSTGSPESGGADPVE